VIATRNSEVADLVDEQLKMATAHGSCFVAALLEALQRVRPVIADAVTTNQEADAETVALVMARGNIAVWTLLAKQMEPVAAEIMHPPWAPIMRDVLEARRAATTGPPASLSLTPAEFGESQMLDCYSIPRRKEIDARKADSTNLMAWAAWETRPALFLPRPLSFAFEARP
jgi:hypothetical protein